MLWQDRAMKRTATLLAVLAIAACSKKTPGTSEADIGVKECDEYVTKYEACLAKMAPEAKSQGQLGFDAQRAAFKANATTPEGRQMLAAQCRAALDAIKPTCGN